MTNKNRKKKMEEQTPGEVKLKGYLDMIVPSVIQFYTDHYICGNTYRSVWALREYPTVTVNLAFACELYLKAILYEWILISERHIVL